MFREGHVLHVYVILSTGRYDILKRGMVPGEWDKVPGAEGMVLGGQYTLPAGSDI